MQLAGGGVFVGHFYVVLVDGIVLKDYSSTSSTHADCFLSAALGLFPPQEERVRLRQRERQTPGSSE